MSLLIIDDHPLVRRGIVDILKISNEESSVYEASTIEESMKILKQIPIELMIIDLHLGSKSGFDLIELIRKEKIAAQIIVLTSSSKVQDFKRAKKMDVQGYILKDAFIEEIIYAIGAIRRGNKFFSHQLVETMENEEAWDALTEREKEIFEYVKEGANNAAIAKELYITEGTVKKHISNILGKLGVINRVELMVYAQNR